MGTPNYSDFPAGVNELLDLEARLKAAIEEISLLLDNVERKRLEQCRALGAEFYAAKKIGIKNALDILSKHGLTGENDD